MGSFNGVATYCYILVAATMNERVALLNAMTSWSHLSSIHDVKALDEGRGVGKRRTAIGILGATPNHAAIGILGATPSETIHERLKIMNHDSSQVVTYRHAIYQLTSSYHIHPSIIYKQARRERLDPTSHASITTTSAALSPPSFIYASHNIQT